MRKKEISMTMYNKKLMVRYILLFSLFLLMTTLSHVIPLKADQSSSISYSYERFVAEQRYDLAKRWLDSHTASLQASFASADQENQERINELIRHNKEILNRSDISANYKLNTARSLVIALDAMTESSQSIWIKSKQALEDSLISLVESGDYSKQRIDSILTHWDMLKPALQIVLEDDDYTLLANEFAKLQQSEHDREVVTKSVINQYQLIDIETTSQSDALSFYWIILMVGGVIILTLSYVAWRKYKAEKKRKQKQLY